MEFLKKDLHIFLIGFKVVEGYGVIQRLVSIQLKGEPWIVWMVNDWDNAFVLRKITRSFLLYKVGLFFFKGKVKLILMEMNPTSEASEFSGKSSLVNPLWLN